MEILVLNLELASYGMWLVIAHVLYLVQLCFGVPIFCCFVPPLRCILDAGVLVSDWLLVSLEIPTDDTDSRQTAVLRRVSA